MATRHGPPRVRADRDLWYSPARLVRALFRPATLKTDEHKTDPRRTTGAVRLLAVASAVALAVAAPGAAMAEPKDDLDTVQKKVDSLSETASKVTEDYDEARVHLADAKRKVTVLNKRASTKQAQVERLRRSISLLAASAYMGGASDLAALATAKTPQDFVDKAASLEQLSTQDHRRIAKFDEANRLLKAQRKAADTALKDQQKIAKRIKVKKSAVVATLAKQKRLLERLEAAGRTDDRASRGDRGGNVNLPPASGRAGAAIAFAEQQLGKPYQWGGDGPGSYDCSGLTMAAWQRGGVSLPHSSRSQQSSGPSVSKSQLAPGDLVFFGSPVHHVGLYVGGGKMIHAPNSGDVVKITSINESYYTSNYAGAVRPG